MTIKEITLLSIEEYEKYKSVISRVNSWWWLRSPGLIKNRANFVYSDGNPGKAGVDVSYNSGAIRPALNLSLEISDNLFWYKPEKLIGAKIEYGKYTWTVLDTSFGELYVLCDNVIACKYYDLELNDWDTSELKQWLETEGLNLIVGEGDSADDC